MVAPWSGERGAARLAVADAATRPMVGHMVTIPIMAMTTSSSASLVRMLQPGGGTTHITIGVHLPTTIPTIPIIPITAIRIPAPITTATHTTMGQIHVSPKIRPTPRTARPQPATPMIPATASRP